ncbi:MAG TPA: hypothetical protein VIJ31_03435 [Acidothermaceae bacterium]
MDAVDIVEAEVRGSAPVALVRFLVREFQAWSTRSYNRAIQAPVIPSQAERWLKSR